MFAACELFFWMIAFCTSLSLLIILCDCWIPVYTIQPVVKVAWQPAVSCIQPVVKSVVQPGLTTGWTNSGCLFNLVERTVAVRSTRLSNRFDSWLYRVNKHPTGRQTGFTIGWMFVYRIQPVVKPVWQPVVSCKRGITQAGLYCSKQLETTFS